MSTINSASKPVSVAPDFKRVPGALTVHHRWVVWRWEPRSARAGRPQWTKPPYNARTGKAASTTDPDTWSTYEEAVAAFERGGWDGVGVVLAPPLSGIDLDDVVDPLTGDIHPEALRIVHEIKSYTEISPSGRGLRIFTHGALPTGWRNTKKFHFAIEVYDGGRYLTVTGAHIPAAPLTIEERAAELAALHERIAIVINRASGATANGHRPQADEELLERARHARNGDKFRRLFDRGVSEGEDHSGADLTLCSTLAFWTARDAERVDRLFRRSALMRPKWDERHYADGRTYGQETIAKAIKACTRVYGGGAQDASTGEIDPEVFREEAPRPDGPERAPFVLVTPPESFVSKYVGMAQQRTDAPSQAHELTAVGVLSAVAGPGPRIPLAHTTDGVRLNLWTMNVADSTDARKTVTLEMGVDLVTGVLGEEAILPWEGSPQAFVQRLADRDGLINVFARDEYSGLLRQMNRGATWRGFLKSSSAPSTADRSRTRAPESGRGTRTARRTSSMTPTEPATPTS